MEVPEDPRWEYIKKLIYDFTDEHYWAGVSADGGSKYDYLTANEIYMKLEITIKDLLSKVPKE